MDEFEISELAKKVVATAKITRHSDEEHELSLESALRSNPLSQLVAFCLA